MGGNENQYDRPFVFHIFILIHFAQKWLKNHNIFMPEKLVNVFQIANVLKGADILITLKYGR